MIRFQQVEESRDYSTEEKDKIYWNGRLDGIKDIYYVVVNACDKLDSYFNY